MKKNLIQYLTLLLCLILLSLCITQTVRLEAYRSQLGREIDELKNQLSSEINGISYDLRSELEEAAQPVETYEISLAKIDYENRTIALDVSVTLKQWNEETAVSLIASAAGEKNIISMTTDGTGTYFVPLDIPLEQTQDVCLEAMVATGGVSTKTDLGGYPDIASQLPLRSGGCGWSETTYRKGTMILDFEQYLEWQWEPGAISNARFEIYINEELYQTINAQEAGNHTFRLPSTELACEDNDTVQLVFRCDDSFGLSYRIDCFEAILEDGDVVETISSDDISFYWSTEAENCDH